MSATRRCGSVLRGAHRQAHRADEAIEEPDREAELAPELVVDEDRVAARAVVHAQGLERVVDVEARAEAEVKEIAVEHLDRIDQKVADLREMRDTLSALVEACAGDHRPDCPILESLARGGD